MIFAEAQLMMTFHAVQMLLASSTTSRKMQMKLENLMLIISRTMFSNEPSIGWESYSTNHCYGIALQNETNAHSSLQLVHGPIAQQRPIGCGESI